MFAEPRFACLRFWVAHVPVIGAIGTIATIGTKDAFIMKQSAARTLGVAALGAAFAAAGAGVASAAPALPDAPGLDTATQTLPAGNVAGMLPGAGEALGQGQNALGKVAAVGMPIAQQALTEGPTKPVSGLLGGLPLGGLPTHGLPVNGIPVG